MSLIKRVGYGNSIAVDVTGGTTFVNVGSVVDGFGGPDAKAKEVNVSLLTDWFEKSAPSGVDPGSVTFMVAYDPAFSESHTLATLLGSGAIANWQLTFAAASANPTETFLGYVAGLGREMKKEGMVTCNVTIKISGDPGYKTS